MICTDDVLFQFYIACSVINLLFYISLSKKKALPSLCLMLLCSTVNKSSMSMSMSERTFISGVDIENSTHRSFLHTDPSVVLSW